MTFSEMITTLGIETYPDKLPEIFENEREPIDLSAEALRRIEEEYGTMGERLSDLIACAEAVSENEALREYTRCGVKFLEGCFITIRYFYSASLFLTDFAPTRSAASPTRSFAR